MKNKFKKGDTVLAFDCREWTKKGDIGDNSIYYKKAEILKIRWFCSLFTGICEYVADLKWNHDGSISHGHFLTGLKLIK